jgi:stage IV sporulation protein FB
MTLSFQLGRIPVRIHQSFFVTTVLFAALGVSTIAQLPLLVAWVLVVLGSVLLHELGHATLARAFGLEPQIQLHGMGGTTSWTAASGRLSTVQRAAVSLAGPGVGFVLAGAVLLARKLLVPGVLPETPTTAVVIGMLLRVNVVWGALNLLPMLPLDGGDVMAQVLNAFTGGRGERPARFVSIVVAASAAVLAVVAQWWWPALLAASFVTTNWRSLKDLEAREQRQAARIADPDGSRSGPVA